MACLVCYHVVSLDQWLHSQTDWLDLSLWDAQWHKLDPDVPKLVIYTA